MDSFDKVVMEGSEMGSNEIVKAMVIGVGALGRHHARILANMDDVELIGVADPNTQQAEAVASQHETRWVADYRDLVDECDAVSLVAPTFLHHEIARDCLSRRKDILVEKPLTADVDQAIELTDLAFEQDAVLQVGHIERFNPAYELLCDTLSSVPRYIRAERLSPFPFRSLDIGAIHDLMIHDIELVLDLMGTMPNRVEAFGVKLMGAHEDTVQARLHFPGGGLADITASRVNTEAKRVLNVLSETESVMADLQARTVTHHRPTDALLDGPAMEDRMRAGEDVADLKSQVFGEFIEVETIQAGDADQLTAELSEFVSCVRNRTRPSVDGTTALKAVKVAAQIRDAVQMNCIEPRKRHQQTKAA